MSASTMMTTTQISAPTACRSRVPDGVGLIRAALNQRLPQLSRFVQCDYVDGVAVLHGKVSRYYLKQMAQECLRSILCVDQIDNRIEVVRS